MAEPDAAQRLSPSFDRRAVVGGLLTAAAALPRSAVAATPQGPHRRIVSLDYGLAETLIRLGQPPLAIAAAQDWAKWVVEPALPAEVVNLGTSREPNLELLQQLRPDAILITPYLAGVSHRLRQIAPTVSLPIYVPEGRPLALAEDAARQLARMTGREEAGERLLAEAADLFAAVRARLQAQPRQPVYLVNFMDGRHVRVYGAKSLFQDVLGRLGLDNAWRGQTNYWGFATVGLEALDHAGEAQLLYLDPVPPGVMPALARNPLWNSLAFVRTGRVRGLPPILMFGALPSAMRFARLIGERLTEEGAT